MPKTYTIGIPVTKVRYLSETLKGLNSQTETSFEVHVVDNHADGDVVAIIRDFPSLQVRLFRRETQLPPVDNWNAMLSHVYTPWFILLSDDDYFEANHLAQFSTLLARQPSPKIMHTRVRLVDEAGDVVGLTPALPEWECAADFIWHRIAGHRQQFLSDFLWHTETLRGLGGFVQMPCAWGTDDLTAMKMAHYGGIAGGSAPTLNYRIHANSLTSKRDPGPKLEAVEQLSQEIRAMLTKYLGDVYSAHEKETAYLSLLRLESYRLRSLRDLLDKVPLTHLLRHTLYRNHRLGWRTVFLLWLRRLGRN